jgi:hypothetical protein
MGKLRGRVKCVSSGDISLVSEGIQKCHRYLRDVCCDQREHAGEKVSSASFCSITDCKLWSVKDRALALLVV